ncbi:MAG TPA: flavin reductase family protein [Chthoniobacteraceae bacterium]|jgi:flavin reductase (DIM6/NTAB) family NADH-FMN oxidoreductase RutF
MENRERIAPALGKIASGLYIATARLEEGPIGMLCSFVEQAGFEPPMVSVAVGQGRPIIAALDGPGVFGLHVLSKDNNALLKSFARGGGAEAFAGHELVENAHGVPQLAEAWAFLLCKVTGKLSTGDHVVYVAEVLDGVLQHEGQESMVRVRANGFSY